MKFNQLFIYTFLLLLFTTPAYSVNSTVKPAKKTVNEAPVHPIQQEWEELSRKEKRAKKKELRKELKSALKDAKQSKKSAAASESTILLVIVAIFIPPLAMALYDGISKRFWISLLLTFLFFLPGLIYTLYIILSGK